jgi:2-(1,2-epoxy-1,2-dihydrophenyl)acetyl-CoA isomerase
VSELLISDRDNVRTITLNRPESFNSFTVSVKEKFLAELTQAAEDQNVRAVVITGTGKAFCAGQDLKEHLALIQSGDSAPLRTVADHYSPIVKTIVTMPKPVIAAVNGVAAGAGASIAFACDLRIAADTAKFHLAFAAVGLSADSGVSWTLQRLIGYGRAMEMMLLGYPVPVHEALRIGMVNQVVSEAETLTTAQALATKLAQGPTVAYAKIKEAMAAAAIGTFDEALAVESRTQAEAGATVDHREAVEAFVAKRTPHFIGR